MSEGESHLAKVLNNRVKLRGLVGRAIRRLLREHHVRVHVSMDDVAVVVSADGALDADEAMLGGRREHRIRQPHVVALRVPIRLDPGDVLAAAVTPLAEAFAPPLARAKA